MTLLEWLDTSPSPAVSWTLKERLAELIAVNGGIDVRGWGIQHVGSGPYGRMGLTQEEALELIYLRGIWVGLKLAHQGAGEPEAVAAIRAEIEKQATKTQLP